MIQDYEIKNGIVKAYDDNKGIVDFEYQNNIDEVFIQQNVVEKIQDDIDFTKSKKIDREQKLREIEYSAKFAKIFVAILSVIIILLTYLYSGLIGCVFSILPTVLASSFMYIGELSLKNELKNKINANTVTIEELEKLLEKENKKLNELKNNKENDKVVDKSLSFYFRNEQRLNEIDNLKKIYRTCGYYAKKLEKYKEKGILRDKIDDTIIDEDLEIIENIIKEKRHQLTKKKIN